MHHLYILRLSSEPHLPPIASLLFMEPDQAAKGAVAPRTPRAAAKNDSPMEFIQLSHDLITRLPNNVSFGRPESLGVDGEGGAHREHPPPPRRSHPICPHSDRQPERDAG